LDLDLIKYCKRKGLLFQGKIILYGGFSIREKAWVNTFLQLSEVGAAIGPKLPGARILLPIKECLF